MFELVTMVLTMAKSDAYNSTADVADAELSSYAAKSWSDYLLRLNPCVPHKTKYEYPGAESVIMMISNVLDVDEIRNDALAKIESQAKINRTNADKIAKSIWDWSNMYLEEDGYGPKRAKLKSFCRRMRKGCQIRANVIEMFAKRLLGRMLRIGDSANFRSRLTLAFN